jgi:Domain of unknown function (DUF4384)
LLPHRRYRWRSAEAARLVVAISLSSGSLLTRGAPVKNHIFLSSPRKQSLRAKKFRHPLILLIALSIAAASCTTTTGVNPTGLMGAQIMCPTGPRPALDCRGVLQQYSRDLKADLNAMSKVQIGLGLTTTKLTEADALTSDLLQHSYQTCTLYNACIIPPQDYAAKAEKLQDVQLQVRRALIATGYGQQNIQINPIPGGGFPGAIPGQVPGGYPGAYPGSVPGMIPNVPGGAPPFPQPGMPPPSFPGQPSMIPFGDPNVSPGAVMPPQFPGASPSSAQGVAVNIPGTPAGQPGDAILNILREGSQVMRGVTPSPAAADVKPPQQDLDTLLRSMLQSLKDDVNKRDPQLASGRAVVGNFTEENRPWSSPLGALLQERVSAIVSSDGLFKQSTGVLTRGISVKEAAAVANPNDPKALPALYNSDLAITGTYQAQGDQIAVKLAALQDTGEIAQERKSIPLAVIPNVVAATPQNAADTSQLLNSLNQIGPRADGKISITTNRPGAGPSYRLGEEIIYFINSNTDGYLYLFHSDADKSVARIFPNQYQREAKIQTGQTLQVPAPGAPFKFEASPPFGLETTFAIVSATPLSDADLQAVQNGFAGPKQDAPAFLKSRGINLVQANPSSLPATAPVLWNSIAVLVRP